MGNYSDCPLRLRTYDFYYFCNIVSETTIWICICIHFLWLMANSGGRHSWASAILKFPMNWKWAEMSALYPLCGSPLEWTLPKSIHSCAWPNIPGFAKSWGEFFHWRWFSTLCSQTRSTWCSMQYLQWSVWWRSHGNRKSSRRFWKRRRMSSRIREAQRYFVPPLCKT